MLSARMSGSEAHELGCCRMMPQGKSDLTCIAFTAGAAVLAVLQWLQDLRCANISAHHRPFFSAR